MTWANCHQESKKLRWMNWSASERKIPKPGWLWYQPTICCSGEPAIQLLMDLLPCVVGERHGGGALDRVERGNRAANGDGVVVCRPPDQNAAHLAIETSKYVPIDLVADRVVQDDHPSKRPLRHDRGTGRRRGRRAGSAVRRR